MRFKTTERLRNEVQSTINRASTGNTPSEPFAEGRIDYAAPQQKGESPKLASGNFNRSPIMTVSQRQRNLLIGAIDGELNALEAQISYGMDTLVARVWREEREILRGLRAQLDATIAR